MPAETVACDNAGCERTFEQNEMGTARYCSLRCKQAAAYRRRSQRDRDDDDVRLDEVREMLRKVPMDERPTAREILDRLEWLDVQRAILGMPPRGTGNP